MEQRDICQKDVPLKTNNQRQNCKRFIPVINFHVLHGFIGGCDRILKTGDFKEPPRLTWLKADHNAKAHGEVVRLTRYGVVKFFDRALPVVATRKMARR